MHYHLRVHRWVIDWIAIGVVCGIVMLVNVLLRKPSVDEITLTLFFGGLYWLIGGVICYTLEAVKLDRTPHTSDSSKVADTAAEQCEYHCASDFVLPGSSHHLFPRHR